MTSSKMELVATNDDLSIGKSLRKWPAQEEQYVGYFLTISTSLLTDNRNRRSLPASSASWSSGQMMRSDRTSNSKMPWPSASQPETLRLRA
jgi:hypothetical protein